MDPDANLEEMRVLARQIAEGDAPIEDAMRLAELTLALDGWISQGGFLPQEWMSRGPVTTICSDSECGAPGCALVSGRWYCLLHLRDLAQR